ncbi:2Fe-2S iron-sulfur cluster-binding protein [Streptomyces sp. KMM 9044]|uniref:2Fe-2S iron-sulfur cluster-binding protein n=1 Tax=Streptomyces sp. KMM 9044 TaxID=2744474 RepID=UPI002151D8D4|nr:2Fe-2S iron-sulfur cluster-binding protein [Streptomyces sp. KMM 9044]WAX79769.1 2Fe-2S iron-sulfur cluster-binding protein [Streptomyces sp. KMM 9044]
MTDDQRGEGTSGASQGGGSRWDPLPQGDYDDGATAFVKLPEGGIDALLDSMESPLAAPGHGYVPPSITATTAGTDPAVTGGWAVPDTGVPGAPVDGTQWHDSQAGRAGEGPGAQAAQQYGGQDRFTYDPGASGQWHFEDPPGVGDPAQAPGSDVTGQWSIPVAGGDLPDESGEFTTSALAEQWGATPPVTPPPTLPGGASAPWATQAIGQPWGPGVPGVDPEHPDSAPGREREQDREQGREQDREQGGPETDRRADHGRGAPAYGQEHTADPVRERPDGWPAPGHDAPPRSAEVPQPDPAESHWRTGTETYPESADGPSAPELREHPQPGPEDAARPVDGHGQALEADEAARDAQRPQDPHDAQEGPGGPSDAAAPESARDHTETAPDGDAGTESAAPGTGTGPDAPDATSPGHEPLLGAAHDDHPLASYVLRVNGTDRPVTDAWIGESLLYVLRERLGLAGAKDGCSQGECGACNVQVDGRLVASCLVPAVTAAGSEVRTVEGLAQDGRPSDVQRALARCGAVQCGFCVPGMAMTVHDLLEGNPAPTPMEARQALCGNLCRCSGYRGVVDAVQEVVAERQELAAHAEADQDEGRDTDTDPGPDRGSGGGTGEFRIPHQAGPGAGGIGPAAFTDPGPHDRPHGRDGGQA